jgi:plastocyanin
MTLLQSLAGFGVLLGSIGTGWAADHVVTANPNLTFTPSSLTINAGDTITFKNAGGFHNVVTSNGSGSVRCAAGCDGHGGNGAPSEANWSATVAFNTAGTFGYHCEIHVSDGMVGTVTVNAVAPPPPPPPPPPTINVGGYLSGNWFMPNQGGGQGFQLEFTNSNNDMLAIWFAYTPAGSAANDGSGQNWIYAQGAYDTTKNTVTLPAILLAGARFPPNFHPADVHRVPSDASTWGTITFTFSDCNTGTVSWHSTLAGYDQANDTPVAIQRLTQIAGTTCPQ